MMRKKIPETWPTSPENKIVVEQKEQGQAYHGPCKNS
jgi:hypothetical protein